MHTQEGPGRPALLLIHARRPFQRVGCSPCSPGGRADLLLLVRTRCRMLPLSRWLAGFGPAATVTGLAALAAGFGGELGILREAALLIRDALTSLAARYGGELAILRKAAFRTRDALPALATRFGREPAVLREAALLIRDRLAAHACYLPLPLGVH